MSEKKQRPSTSLPIIAMEKVREGAILRPQTPSSGTPTETWEDEDAKSGVHTTGESQLDTIARISRDVRATGSTTLDTLVKHDAQIQTLITEVSSVAARVTSVEVLGSEIKEETQKQSAMLETQLTTQKVQDAKLDVMLKVLDPSAPERIKRIVHEEITVTDMVEQKQATREIVKSKHERNMELLRQGGAILIAVIAAGGLGYLAHGC